MKVLIQENSQLQDLMVYTDGSVTKDQSGWGFTVKKAATTIHKYSAHKAKDTTPSTAWSREAWKEGVLDDLLESMNDQSDVHWNHFKCEVRETSERQGGVHMGFYKCMNTILN